MASECTSDIVLYQPPRSEKIRKDIIRFFLNVIRMYIRNSFASTPNTKAQT